MHKKAYALAFATIFAFSLSSCGKDGSTDNTDLADDVASSTISDEAATPAVEPTSETSQLLEMPSGFIIPFPTELVRDHLVDTAAGKQRRIQLHAPGISPESAGEQIAAALKAAGFKGGKTVENGGFNSVNYRKDGRVVVIVSIQKTADDGGTKIRFGWVN